MSFKRKIKRKQEREAKKQLKKDIAQKVNMFDKLPVECSACQKTFDKKDREMVMSWSVVVREQEGIVRLYCPACWEKAKSIIKELQDA